MWKVILQSRRAAKTVKMCEIVNDFQIVRICHALGTWAEPPTDAIKPREQAELPRPMVWRRQSRRNDCVKGVKELVPGIKQANGQTIVLLLFYFESNRILLGILKWFCRSSQLEVSFHFKSPFAFKDVIFGWILE